jgi:hypothetical protein
MSIMPPAPEPFRARRTPRTKRGPAILAALMRGNSLDEIAAAQRISRVRVENALREELQRCWAPRHDDYARFQIASLDRMAGRLVSNTEHGDLRAVDRLLRLNDRLDRYRGFTKGTPAALEDYGTIHERLMAKINSALARSPAPVREDS